MAHCDYHCCAVCDVEMGGVVATGEVTVKEHLCVPCMRRLKVLGFNIFNANDLAHWMGINKAKKVLEVLSDLGFKKCSYTNIVDHIYEIQKANL